MPESCECGFQIANLKTSPYLGCPKCYDVFREELEVILTEIQSRSIKHKGRTNSNCENISRDSIKEEDISDSERKSQLEQAIMNGEFELANELKKQIENERHLDEQSRDSSSP